LKNSLKSKAVPFVSVFINDIRNSTFCANKLPWCPNTVARKTRNPGQTVSFLSIGIIPTLLLYNELPTFILSFYIDTQSSESATNLKYDIWIIFKKKCNISYG
jgi:hypothetical protein